MVKAEVPYRLREVFGWHMRRYLCSDKISSAQMYAQLAADTSDSNSLLYISALQKKKSAAC